MPIPRGVLEFVIFEHVAKDKTVLVYCRNGYRAALAASTLMDLGYDKVFNAGGFGELEAAGVSTTSFGPPSDSADLPSPQRPTPERKSNQH